MIAETARQFIDNEVRPRIAELEKQDWKLARELVQKGAELGLRRRDHSGGVRRARPRPDERRGIVGEALGRAASFATTIGAQSGIGLLPILYFGTEEPKQKYLPKHRLGRADHGLRADRGRFGLGRARGKGDGASERGRHALRPQRREDVDHERRLRRRVHRLRQGRRRQVHRLHRRAAGGAHERRRGAQDGHQGLVHDGARARRREDARRESARRGRQGSQDRLQHPEHRPLQARRDVPRRDEAGDVTSRCATPTSASSSASRSHRSARSSTSSPRWRSARGSARR